MRVQQINTQNHKNFGNKIVLKERDFSSYAYMISAINRVIKNNTNVRMDSIHPKFIKNGGFIKIITDGKEKRLLDLIEGTFSEDLFEAAKVELAQNAEKIDVFNAQRDISFTEQECRNVESIISVLKNKGVSNKP